MSLLPLLVCFKILIDPFTMLFHLLIPLQCHFISLIMSFHLFAHPISYYLCEFSPPLSTISTKGELKFWMDWGETMLNEDHFPNLVQSRSLAKDI